jgi:hypothetical protein
MQLHGALRWKYQGACGCVAPRAGGGAGAAFPRSEFGLDGGRWEAACASQRSRGHGTGAQFGGETQRWGIAAQRQAGSCAAASHARAVGAACKGYTAAANIRRAASRCAAGRHQGWRKGSADWFQVGAAAGPRARGLSAPRGSVGAMEARPRPLRHPEPVTPSPGLGRARAEQTARPGAPAASGGRRSAACSRRTCQLLLPHRHPPRDEDVAAAAKPQAPADGPAAWDAPAAAEQPICQQTQHAKVGARKRWARAWCGLDVLVDAAAVQRRLFFSPPCSRLLTPEPACPLSPESRFRSWPRGGQRTVCRASWAARCLWQTASRSSLAFSTSKAAR